MFVDIAQVKIKAGDGGNGAVSFRHEIYVDKGGPDGGDGGKGGDVIFEASNNQNTLANFRFNRLLTASPGHSGSKRKKHGKSGKDLVVLVPVGTILTNQDGMVIADLQTDGQKAIVARGGLGGYGNAHFVSSTRQAPRIAEKGELGQELGIMLELKMIADVGLVGLPNAGKSTLLSVVSNAQPEIANYPFTTLTPNLGVVDVDKSNSLLFADIPGLIEGASEGKGLGDEFLRHVERTKVLIHLIDIYQNDVANAYKTIQKELKDYKIDLSKRPQIVVLTKTEGLDAELINLQKQALETVLTKKQKVMVISAASRDGLKELIYAVQKLVKAEHAKVLKKAGTKSELPVITISNEQAWRVSKQGKGYLVTGQRIEKFAGRTDFENFHGTQRLRDIMKKMGILHELVRQGVQPGDSVQIGKYGSVDY